MCDGDLACHFIVEKTYSMLKEHYYWPKMAKGVEHFEKSYITYHLAKSHVLPQILYTPLPVLQAPCEDAS